MREIHTHLAPYWLGGLIEATSVDGGPTDEQLRIVQGLLRGYFGVESAIDLVPLPAEELKEVIVDLSSRYRLVQTMIVLQFARHPASEMLADSVERYAATLGVDEPMLVVARDAAIHSRQLLMADWARFARNSPMEPQRRDQSDDEFGAQFEALRQCPDGSLGRAFIDFYESNGFAMPSAATGLGVSLVNHDFSHIITGYKPNDAVEEVALSAMLVSSANGEEHFERAGRVDGPLRSGALRHPGHRPDQGSPGPPRCARCLCRRHAPGSVVLGRHRHHRPSGPGRPADP